MNTFLLQALESAKAFDKNNEKKVILTLRVVEEVEKSFEQALEFGLEEALRRKDEDVTGTLCSIFSCMDDQRSKRYIMAFGNSIANKPRTTCRNLAEHLISCLDAFPHMKTEGMTNLVHHVQMLANRSRVA